MPRALGFSEWARLFRFKSGRGIAHDAHLHFPIGGDLSVFRIGFGAARLLGRASWGEPAEPDVAIALLRRAVTLGVNLVDTAEAYGPGTNERLIARALAPYPAGLVIGTKCGLLRTWEPDTAHPKMTPNGSRAAIRQSILGSLARLGLEWIDLYQLHRIDPEAGLETSIEALAEMRAEGRVRHIGRPKFLLPRSSVRGRLLRSQRCRTDTAWPTVSMRTCSTIASARHRLHPLVSARRGGPNCARRAARTDRRAAWSDAGADCAGLAVGALAGASGDSGNDVDRISKRMWRRPRSASPATWRRSAGCGVNR
jgi:hypothetical protein